MSSNEDSRGGLDGEPYAYQEMPAGKVMITWRGRRAAILKGDNAQSFLMRIADLDPAARQQLMARVTGNFKRGNER